MPDVPDLAYACRLPPEDAIAYLESKGYAIGFSWRDVWQEAHAKAFTAAGVMKVDVLADLKAGLVDALKEGTTRQDYLRNLTAILQRKGWWGYEAQVDPVTGEMAGKGLTPRRLATIFDTNLQSAYMAGRYKAFLANVADRPYWQYVAVMDSRTRPAHAALNGRTFRHDDPIWRTHWPPNGFRCFPPETLLRADAEIGLKTWYAGEMVEFETGLGKKLTVTANHPILTGRGRLPAHAIKEGEQVLCDAGIIDARVPGVVDHRQPPASAENLFEALKPQGFRIVPMAANDFHGDALLRKPEIHVAGPDRVLMDEIELEAQQFIGQRHFRQTHGGAIGHANLAGRPPLAGSILVNAVLAQESADVAEAGIQALGDGSLRGHTGTVKGEHAALDVGVNAVRGGPCRTELAAKGGGIALDRLPFESFGFASAAQGNAVAAENAPECGTTEAQLIRELLEANSGLIALDQVVWVRKFDWAGHVFDFQTATGLMFAAGIVVYNCRCGVRALDAEDLQARGIDLSSSEGRLSDIEVSTSRHPDGPTATVTRFEYAPGKFFAPDAGWSYNPGAAALKPFAPPPLDDLPRTFSPGVPLPDLPAPTRVAADRLLAPGLPPEDYAHAFLAEFGADVGQGVVFRDVTGAPLVIDEALFQDGAGNWKAAKDGRGPFMRLLAESVQAPDEIWLRWEESREAPGTWRLKRRYLRSFEVMGDDGPQYGLSVFEYGKDGWSGSTAMMSQADRGPAARLRYIERQRDGFLLYRKPETP